MESHQATAERTGRELVPPGAHHNGRSVHELERGGAGIARRLPVPRIVPGMSDRLVRIEEHRWLGDKRSFVVHDQDNICDTTVLDDIAAAESWLTFGPDTSIEARNRGYKVCPACAAKSPD